MKNLINFLSKIFFPIKLKRFYNKAKKYGFVISGVRYKTKATLWQIEIFSIDPHVLGILGDKNFSSKNYVIKHFFEEGKKNGSEKVILFNQNQDKIFHPDKIFGLEEFEERKKIVRRLEEKNNLSSQMERRYWGDFLEETYVELEKINKISHPSKKEEDQLSSLKQRLSRKTREIFLDLQKKKGEPKITKNGDFILVENITPYFGFIASEYGIEPYWAYPPVRGYSPKERVMVIYDDDESSSFPFDFIKSKVERYCSYPFKFDKDWQGSSLNSSFILASELKMYLEDYYKLLSTCLKVEKEFSLPQKFQFSLEELRDLYNMVCKKNISKEEKKYLKEILKKGINIFEIKKYVLELQGKPDMFEYIDSNMFMYHVCPDSGNLCWRGPNITMPYY